MASKSIVVILGAGPGLGQACGRIFANKGHPVALLSRSLDRLEQLSNAINKEVGDTKRTRPYAVDVTKKEDIESTFEKIKSDFKEAKLHTAIYNAGGLFQIKSFLDLTEADFRKTYDIQCIGALHFTQAFLRSLQQQSEWQEWQKDPNVTTSVGNLLITGATSALRGSAKMSSFSHSSFALRSMAQSIAREFGPQGVHVAHFILDGMVDTERLKEMVPGDYEPNSRMKPEDIAQVYYDTVQQKRSVWAFETDLRPAKEKW